jgi:hypothetical protein
MNRTTLKIGLPIAVVMGVAASAGITLAHALEYMATLVVLVLLLSLAAAALGARAAGLTTGGGSVRMHVTVTRWRLLAVVLAAVFVVATLLFEGSPFQT